jgi:hypothetical protein
MLSELNQAVKEFNSVIEKELNFSEGELLGFAWYANGEIILEDNLLGQPYVRIGSQHYNSSSKIKAEYRDGLASLIKKGYAEIWHGNKFILTKSGWDRAAEIVEITKKTISGYYDNDN